MLKLRGVNLKKKSKLIHVTNGLDNTIKYSREAFKGRPRLATPKNLAAFPSPNPRLFTRTSPKKSVTILPSITLRFDGFLIIRFIRNKVNAVTSKCGGSSVIRIVVSQTTNHNTTTPPPKPEIKQTEQPQVSSIYRKKGKRDAREEKRK